jgi:hypothetical protein
MALNEVPEQRPSARMPDVDEPASKERTPGGAKYRPTLTVERIPNATGTTIVFPNHYQNSSILSVNDLVAKAHVVIEDKDGYNLNESVSAPAFSAMLMGREERGFSVVVRPTKEEIDSADRGDLPDHHRRRRQL